MMWFLNYRAVLFFLELQMNAFMEGCQWKGVCTCKYKVVWYTFEDIVGVSSWRVHSRMRQYCVLERLLEAVSLVSYLQKNRILSNSLGLRGFLLFPLDWVASLRYQFCVGHENVFNIAEIVEFERLFQDPTSHSSPVVAGHWHMGWSTKTRMYPQQTTV